MKKGCQLFGNLFFVELRTKNLRLIVYRRQSVRDWSGILCERVGNEFRGRDEVTELVEVPSPYPE